MFVYLIGAFNLRGAMKAVKIGVSGDLDRRVSQLQTGQILELRLVAAWHTKSRKQAFWVESEMHASFERMQMRGEWFRPYPVETMMHRLSQMMRKQPCVVSGHGCQSYVDAALRHEEKKDVDGKFHDLAMLAKLRESGLTD